MREVAATVGARSTAYSHRWLMHGQYGWACVWAALRSRSSCRLGVPMPDRDLSAPMRFAYADPPYLGCGKLYVSHHPDARDWDDPETPRAVRSLGR